MRKALLILIAILVTFSLFGCGGETPDDPNKGNNTPSDKIDVIKDAYALIYNKNDTDAISIMNDMLDEINSIVGSKPDCYDSGVSEDNYEIEFGLKTKRELSKTVYKEISSYAGEERCVYTIRVVNKKIVISASDSSALLVAAKRFSSFAEEGKLLIGKKFEETVVFDKEAYQKSGEIVEIDVAELENNADLLSISINKTPVPEFDPTKNDYNLVINDSETIDVKATADVAGAELSVSIEGMTVKVTVKSMDSKNEKVYSVKMVKKLDSKVVNKGGADATVSFVIDDGDQTTATFVLDKMSPKYKSLTASFAIITSKLATLEIVTNSDGSKEYFRDADGFYSYTKNDAVWAFWKNVANNKNFELLSHSHSHQYWGENDGGGKFTYYNTQGTEFVSDELPKGSVSAEFIASKQIIQALDPTQRVAAFVRVGLSAGGKSVKYSETFWDPISTSGAYIGARGTYTQPDNPRDMVNSFHMFSQEATRNNVKSYMVEHYNTNPDQKTQKDSTAAECLAAGIPYWTNYIDTAVSMNGWAVFCIHNIKPDTYKATSGHYIYESQADSLFAYVENLANGNKVWIATFSDALIYANERSSATTEAYYDGEKITVSLDHEEAGEYYDMPLTVKLALPSGMTSASLDGEILDVFTENGINYVYVDVAPKTSVTLSVN